ncbi:unnamed protein product [Cuscuta europaea]|uniref:HMA domain-containing protein n=1 Tax=Cuscuta europaea TaxID=41803 RepID=A0A9P0YJC6_CUSEU|nr:unnamed protein product [Cuscuta europaea]
MPPKKEGEKKEERFSYKCKITLNCDCDGCRNEVFRTIKKHCGVAIPDIKSKRVLAGGNVEWDVEVTNSKTNQKQLEGYLKEVKQGIKCEANDIKSKENGDGKKSKPDGNGGGEKKSGNGDGEKKVVEKKDDAGKEKNGGGGGQKYNERFHNSAALAGSTQGPYVPILADLHNELMETHGFIKVLRNAVSEDDPFACSIL